MNYYIGIDLGGTNVRVCKVDENGFLAEDHIAPSHGLEGPKKIEENIISLLKLVDMEGVKSIGLAIPGPVDGEKNVITIATNIPGCENYPFADHIKEEFNIPTFLDNDANAAGLAEALLGAGKGKKVVYYLTHSTGIGGGLIVDGKIVSGHRGYAGEVANLIVDSNAKRYDAYSHLNVGAVESIASGRALGMIGEEKIGEEANSGKKIFDLASQGNKQALEIIDKMSKDFATALSYIAAIVAPDCFVIGGGVSKSHELYFDKVIAYYKTMVHQGMKDVPILLAELKEPGVLGAAMIGKSHIG